MFLGTILYFYFHFGVYLHMYGPVRFESDLIRSHPIPSDPIWSKAGAVRFVSALLGPNINRHKKFVKTASGTVAAKAFETFKFNYCSYQ